MKRRGIGRGRVVLSAGAVFIAIGSFAPWWTLGGTVTARLSGNAFDGVGALCFIAAVLIVALVVLPFATRSGEAGLDRPLSYVALTALAVGAYVLRAVEIYNFGGISLPPQAPGLWLAGLGMAIIVWGVVELLGERPRRDWYG